MMETPNNENGRTPAQDEALAAGAAHRPEPVVAGEVDRYAAAELSVAERQVNILRDKLRHIDRQLAPATQNNSKLVCMPENGKAEIMRLKSALDQEGQPPYSFGTILQLNTKRYPAPCSSGQAATEES